MAAPVRDIDDDEVLCQYGEIGRSFRSRPRQGIETELSLCAAAHSPTAAGVCVRGFAQPRIDACRWTTAGSLRRAGFSVTHAPEIFNPHHVLVGHDGTWDNNTSRRFHSAFEAWSEHDL
jgi:hypothetical protein